jgi:thymidine kinase
MSELGFTNGWVQRRGWVEVIVGGMFSGKTEELIRRLRRAEYARQKIQVFKPVIDTRYSVGEVCSHNQNTIQSLPIPSAHQIWDYLKAETQVVGIDEGQFFDHDLVKVVETLAERGLRVIIAGLDTDWQAKPFEPMPTLMAIAESVTKQHAVCVVCGATASRTQRTGNVDGQVVVGAHDLYEARCREHFKPEVVPPTKIASQGPDPESILAIEASR